MNRSTIIIGGFVVSAHRMSAMVKYPSGGWDGYFSSRYKNKYTYYIKPGRGVIKINSIKHFYYLLERREDRKEKKEWWEKGERKENGGERRKEGNCKWGKKEGEKRGEKERMEI